MKAFVKKLTDKKSQDFANQIGDVFSSLPKLPKGFIEFCVKIAPFFALLGVILSLFASPILGILSIFSVITFNPFFVLSVVLAAVFALLNAVILLLAYKPLTKRAFDGWMLLFWADMLSVAQTVLHIVLRQSSIFSLIGIAIGLYILYQMRPWYKK